jgi:deazaflavin-dependent oxidoreductase (nitroreductase family)
VSYAVIGLVVLTTIAVVALLLVLVVRLAVRAHTRRPAHGHEHGPGHAPGTGNTPTILLAVGRIVQLLIRAGVRLGPVMLLTVRGRKSGLLRTSAVDVFVRDGRYWLIATHAADANWVRNLRVAGEGTLRRGRRLHTFTAVQLPIAEAAAVLKEVAGPRLARPVGGYVLRQTLGVSGNVGLDEFTRVAAEHPVFELSVTGQPLARTVTAPVLAIAAGLLVAAAHATLGLTGLLGPAKWIGGVVIGLLLAGAGNHRRIFGASRQAH